METNAVTLCGTLSGAPVFSHESRTLRFYRLGLEVERLSGAVDRLNVLVREQQLALIEKRIQEDNVKYIVYEENMTEDMVELFNRVQDDCHLTRVELSNLSSLTGGEIDSGKDYLSIMYENLAVLETMAAARTDAVQPAAEEVEETPPEQALTYEEAQATPEPEEDSEENTEQTVG
jgi:hypothetical protein